MWSIIPHTRVATVAHTGTEDLSAEEAVASCLVVEGVNAVKSMKASMKVAGIITNEIFPSLPRIRMKARTFFFNEYRNHVEMAVHEYR